MTRCIPRDAGHRLLLALGFLTLIVAAAAIARAEDEPDPFDVAREAFTATESDSVRFEIVETFLREHPDHPRVKEVIEQGVYLLNGPLADKPAAVALVKDQLARAADENVDDLQDMLMDLYSDPAYRNALIDFVAERYHPADMTYVEHLAVVRAATGAEAWSLLDRHVAAAEDQASAEAFRSAYPDREFSDEYVAEAGRNRQGLLRTYAGWSRANQGDRDAAIDLFAEADELVRQTYLGLPDNELYRFWGTTLVADGRREDGLEKLALAAIFGHDEYAGEQARAVYADLDRRDSYEDYLWHLRREHGATMVDFTATTYDDKAVSYNELKGEKATLLAFWFPT